MKEENKLLNTDIMVLNKKIENLKKLEDANLKLVQRRENTKKKKKELKKKVRFLE